MLTFDQRLEISNRRFRLLHDPLAEFPDGGDIVDPTGHRSPQERSFIDPAFEQIGQTPNFQIEDLFSRHTWVTLIEVWTSTYRGIDKF